MSHKREKRKDLKKWESPKGHLKKVSMYCSKQQGGNKFYLKYVFLFYFYR